MSKYEVLGVSRSAPLQEIKSAYQAAALATHPDKQASLATQALKKQVCRRPSVCVWRFLSRVSMRCSYWRANKPQVLTSA